MIASWPKFCNIIFLFLLKIGSVGPADQQINLVSPKKKPVFDETNLKNVEIIR